jgi:hypothetical protein
MIGLRVPFAAFCSAVKRCQVTTPAAALLLLSHDSMISMTLT